MRKLVESLREKLQRVQPQVGGKATASYATTNDAAAVAVAAASPLDANNTGLNTMPTRATVLLYLPTTGWMEGGWLLLHDFISFLLSEQMVVVVPKEQWSPDLTNHLGQSRLFVKPGYSLNQNTL